MESACQEIIRLAEKVMDGGQITPEEAGRLIRTKDEDTMLLLAMADKIRQKFGGSSVDFCAIINARSGHCQKTASFAPSPAGTGQVPRYIACCRKNRLSKRQRKQKRQAPSGSPLLPAVVIRTIPMSLKKLLQS